MVQFATEPMYLVDERQRCRLERLIAYPRGVGERRLKRQFLAALESTGNGRLWRLYAMANGK